MGFPTIVIAILAVVLGLQDAMALMVLPCVLTNFWQASVGGHFKEIMGRFWSLFLVAILTTWLTTGLLLTIESSWLLCLLGLILCLYALTGLFRPDFSSVRHMENWLTPVVGLVNGVLTGLTGTFVVPGVLYFQSLKMSKEMLIQAMGLLFLISTMALGAGLFENRLYKPELGLLSMAAIIPSFAGLLIGQWVRKHLTERLFRQLFYLALMGLGIYILSRNVPL